MNTKEKSAFLLALLSAIFFSLAGIIWTMQAIVSKDNMNRIAWAYLSVRGDFSETGLEGSAKRLSEIAAKGNAEKTSANVIKAVDDADEAALTEMLSTGNLIPLLASAGNMTSFCTLSDDSLNNLNNSAYSGLGSILTAFKTVSAVAKGDYGFVSLLLNSVEADELLNEKNVETIIAEISEKSHNISADSNNAKAFLGTKLCAAVSVDAAFIYFNYFAGTGPDGGDSCFEKLESEIEMIALSRKNDLTVLLGRTATDDDAKLFSESAANTLRKTMRTPSNMTSPGGARVLMGMFFSPTIGAVNAFFGVFVILFVFLLLKDPANSVTYLAIAFLLTAIITLFPGFLSDQIIGAFYSVSGAKDVADAGRFFLTAGIFGGLALVAFLMKTLVFGKNRKVKFAQTSDGNLTFDEIRLVNQMGLGDLAFKQTEKPEKRPDGLVDYYGDGRGLEAQREYFQKKGIDVGGEDSSTTEGVNPTGPNNSESVDDSEAGSEEDANGSEPSI